MGALKQHEMQVSHVLHMATMKGPVWNAEPTRNEPARSAASTKTLLHQLYTDNKSPN